MAGKAKVKARTVKKSPAKAKPKKEAAKPKAKTPEKKPAPPPKKAVEPKPPAKAAPVPGPVKPAPGGAKPAAGAPGAAAAAPAAKGAKVPGTRPKKAPKPRGIQRRGPDGELLNPGDLLLPGGASSLEELQYLFRGCVAAEQPNPDAGISEVLLKRGVPETDQTRGELSKHAAVFVRRFDGGSIEAALPVRAATRRNFQGVQERAKQRRRELGAFMRGLDIGRTETSHMDSHGEASLQSLMEWAARLENLAEADEPERADYNQFHRGLDQLDNTTEALVVDVELTLRRLRDKERAK
jgi:hypothetical protein